MKTRIKTTVFISVICVIILNQCNLCFSQGVGINTTGNSADGSAMLDVNSTASPYKGLLIPRLTTAQRDAISSPVESLLIYNTTTQCYEGYNATTSTWVAFGCIGCTVPSGVTASASPNPICAGATLTLTGGATDATSWNWTGPNSYTSSLQSPTIAGITTAGAGVYTLTAGNNCGWSAGANTASVSISEPPTTADAGSDINPPYDATTATLAGNDPSVGTGLWTVESGTATITDNALYNSGVTGLAVSGVATLRWTISNSPCTDSYDDVIITTTSCYGTFVDARDGQSYDAVLIGAQCWMADNLNYGTYAANTTPQVSGTKFCQNLAGVNDATCPMGGLYEWANLMQGSGTCNGTGAPPNDECATPVQGLCPAGWHIPSHYEWTTLEKNVGSNPGAFPYDIVTTGWLGTDEGGNMRVTPICGSLPCWNTPNAGATNTSGFAALPGGFSWSGSFSLAGNYGHWWSSTEYDATGAWLLGLYYTAPNAYRGYLDKARGFSVRCVKDN